MIQKPSRLVVRFLQFLIVPAMCLTSYGAGAKSEPPVPDFTNADEIGEKHDWNLGPTGARGWMWGWKLQTTKARQIYVTRVDKGSPADGILQKGDVILGMGDKPFSKDARHAFGEAIGSAEAHNGTLSLTRWRNGETTQTAIQLPVHGGYSATSPFDCEKSQKILDAGCKHIAARMKHDLVDFRKSAQRRPGQGISYSQTQITNAIDALALLASGKPEYLELVGAYAHAFAPPNLELVMNRSTGMASWGWGYIDLFLCEYHLATGDESVLPAIGKYTTSIAKGQSFIGSWGHAMAWPEINHGKLHGSLMGYGALNSAGLICHLSLVLGEKCGVRNQEVQQALEKANRFMGFYTGKGSIPYGDHFPGWDRHDDNGKNSMAAVLFDLQNKREDVRFFTSMTIASYGERERGHTGNYFSFLWGPLGARRAGNEAASAFLKPQRWFYDFNRAWDGSFPYQGGADSGKGENSYSGWDSTGAFMLTYALPLKKLFITGKGTNESNQLTGPSLKLRLAAGAGFTVWAKGMTPYQEKQPGALFKDLKSWSPAVRFRAAAALAGKKDSEKFVPRLVSMLDSRDLLDRYGACQALGALNERAENAVEPLQSLLWEKDTWLRIQAISALANIGKASSPAIPALLRLAITDDEADPLQITQRYLAFGLFDKQGVYGKPGLLSKSLKGVDRDLLYKAVEKILSNPDGRTRGTVASVYDTLTFEELESILPAILLAIEEPSPSGVMFSSGIRLRGIEMLAKHKIREGMALCLQILEINKWGKKKRINQCLEILATYGGAAKPVLPELRQLEKDLLAHPEAKMLAPQAEQVRKLIHDIENSTDSIELRSLN